MMININTTKMLLCIIDGRHPNQIRKYKFHGGPAIDRDKLNDVLMSVQAVDHC